MKYNKEEKMERRKNSKIMLFAAVIMFAAVAFIFVLTLMHYWPYWFGLQEWELYSYVNVTADRGGFDLNGTALTMGLVRQGGASRRNINFTNDYSFPVAVKIGCEGSICPLFSYENPVYVEAYNKTQIEFEARSERNTTVGLYEGFVKFKVVPAQ